MEFPRYHLGPAHTDEHGNVYRQIILDEPYYLLKSWWYALKRIVSRWAFSSPYEPFVCWKRWQYAKRLSKTAFKVQYNVESF